MYVGDPIGCRDRTCRDRLRPDHETRSYLKNKQCSRLTTFLKEAERAGDNV